MSDDSQIQIAKPAEAAEMASTGFLSWMTLSKHKGQTHHRIEISLRDLNQLFNSMDPSPFHERDLDHDAEEFMESWVSEYHRDEPVSLVIHVQKFPEDPGAAKVVEQGIHHYFDYRARLNYLEFKRLMKQGRLSLIIGLVFLGVCLATVRFVTQLGHGTAFALMEQSLLIAGTVAMWRPMEIYLYEWWPLRRRGQILKKMSKMRVEIRRAKVPN